MNAGRQSEYHHGNLRETLVALLVSKLKNSCVTKVSLRELCREAGVSQSALYNHFKTRDELFAAAGAHILKMLLTRISNESQENISREEKVSIARSLLTNLATEQPSLFALCFLHKLEIESPNDLKDAQRRLRSVFAGNRKKDGMFAWWVVLGEATEIFNGHLTE